MHTFAGCAVFGRDESEHAEFSFTQDLVDQMIENWSLTVNNPSYPTKPNPDKMLTLDLCISDKNKPLLLANSSFIPYLISGLFLDSSKHPRGDLNDEIKAWNQQHKSSNSKYKVGDHCHDCNKYTQPKNRKDR